MDEKCLTQSVDAPEFSTLQDAQSYLFTKVPSRTAIAGYVYEMVNERMADMHEQFARIVDSYIALNLKCTLALEEDKSKNPSPISLTMIAGCYLRAH